MRTLQEQPLAVQPKRPVLEAEIAEAAAGRLLVGRGRRVKADQGRHAIQVRIVDLPESRVPDRQRGFHQRVARRKIAIQRDQFQGFTARGGGNAKEKLTPGRLVSGVAQICLNANYARLRIGSDKQVFHPNCRGNDQFDVTLDAAPVVSAAGSRRIAFVAARRLTQSNPVNRLIGRIEHAYGETVGDTRLENAGHIECERVFAAFMAAHVNAVDPNVGQVVDLPEPEQAAAAGVRVRRRREIAPVPGHAMVVGKQVLNNRRSPGRFGVKRWTFPPLVLASDILRVRGQQPRRTIQGNHGRRSHRRRCRLRLLASHRSNHRKAGGDKRQR